MKNIPAIDLLNSRTVTAVGGNRAAYRSTATPLCQSNHPADLVAALLELHPFDIIYVADLDAICNTGSNLATIRALHHSYPEISLWVDNGLTDAELLCEFARPVIGTESLTTAHELAHLVHTLPAMVLSLDYSDKAFIGPDDLEQSPDLWPDEIIVMQLSRVGTASGPDTEHLRQLLHRASGKHLFAAGGIRNHADLESLQAIGITGALLSTALHQGRIDSATLRHFAAI